MTTEATPEGSVAVAVTVLAMPRTCAGLDTDTAGPLLSTVRAAVTAEAVVLPAVSDATERNSRLPSATVMLFQLQENGDGGELSVQAVVHAPPEPAVRYSKRSELRATASAAVPLSVIVPVIGVAGVVMVAELGA